MISNPIEFYCKGDFATLVLPRGSKIPRTKWKDDVTKGRPPEAFRDANIAIRCGVPHGDGYLVVLDIDPRNGGDVSLKDLPPLPMTFTTKTGGGGTHYYFVSDEPLKKCVVAKGIDLQGAGSYVVGAGSSHESGGLYEVHPDAVDYVERIPDWLLERLSAPTEGGTFDPDVYAKPTPEAGSQDAYLTMRAGEFRNQGFKDKALADLLEAVIKNEINGKESGAPYTRRDAERIARSISKKPGLDYVEKKELAPAAKQEPKHYVKDWAEIYDMAPNLVKTLATCLLEQAPRRYPQFALGAALSVVAASVQGGYRAPSLIKVGRPGGMLNLYVWTIAPSAGGKDFYFKAVASLLGAVDPRLIGNKIGSSYGLRSDFFVFNSRIIIIDEMQDELTRWAKSTHMATTPTELKEFANPRDEMPAISIKDRVYPAIKKPKLSIYATGTSSGFNRHLTGETIGGGLLSRFIVLSSGEDIPDDQGQSDLEVDPSALAPLREAFGASLTEVGAAQSIAHELEVFHSMGRAPKPGQPPLMVEHLPQTEARRVVGMSDAARAILLDYRQRGQATYQKLIKDGGADDELGEASLIDRSGQAAVKVAALAAFGGDDRWGVGVPTICDRAAAFAVAFVDRCVLELAERVRNYATTGDRATTLQNKILAALTRHGRLDKTKISRLAKGDGRLRNQALVDLWEQDLIRALELGPDGEWREVADPIGRMGKARRGLVFEVV